MKAHEYQAKEILRQYGVPVPKGRVASTPAEARAVAAEIGGKVVIKAQVHAGGRGRAGGIKTANSPEEAEKLARELIGKQLVTHQTGSKGVPVNSVLVEEAADPARELYVGIVVDNRANMAVMMASEAGGMEIEEVAAQSPEKILRAYVDPVMGFQGSQGRRLAYGMNLEQAQIRPAADIMGNLWRVFREKDCSLAEINPLVVTSDGKLLALDAKLNIDDNSMFRHQDLDALRDWTQEDALEVQAVQGGLANYVKLSGNIGVVVNGAGLAMATMDTLKLYGGEPANFLDIGTVNNPERVVSAFKILTGDPDVKAIYFNIFGGMARVDIIAQGIVEAFRQMEIKVPVVARLTGNMVEEGKRILSEAKTPLIEGANLDDGARKAVAATAGR